jgi:uncharacterized protein (TIGR03437 family)
VQRSRSAREIGAVANVAAQLVFPVTVTIGGVNAQVLYAGLAPGEVEGVIQVNVISVTLGAALPLLARLRTYRCYSRHANASRALYNTA